MYVHKQFEIYPEIIWKFSEMIRHFPEIIWNVTEIEAYRSICVRAQLCRIVDVVNDNMIMVLGACTDAMMCEIHNAF